jgi:hypothetical protein
MEVIGTADYGEQVVVKAGSLSPTSRCSAPRCLAGRVRHPSGPARRGPPAAAAPPSAPPGIRATCSEPSTPMSPGT